MAFFPYCTLANFLSKRFPNQPSLFFLIKIIITIEITKIIPKEPNQSSEKYATNINRTGKNIAVITRKINKDSATELILSFFFILVFNVLGILIITEKTNYIELS